jgi:MFS family permease
LAASSSSVAGSPTSSGDAGSFLSGVALFTAASLLGGFAGNQTTLIAARAIQGIGAAGSLVGGVLVQYLSWRWILFVNVPIGAAVFLVARIYLVESKAEGPRNRLDVAGAITVTFGMVALVYGIVHTDIGGWGSPSTLVTAKIAAVLLASFALIEANLTTHPLIPLRLFRSRGVTGANLAMICFGASTFAMWFFRRLYT